MGMCFLSLCARTLETTTQEAWVSLVVGALGGGRRDKTFFKYAAPGDAQQGAMWMYFW